MNESNFKQKALLAIETLRARVRELERGSCEQIAIIGFAARFPGAPDADAFWSVLQQGTDAISNVPADRWDVDAFYDPNPDAIGKMFTRRAGFVDDATGFDAQFFGISPREAMLMDPQHRLMLETTWHALEHAAVAPASLAGTRTGVFMGLSTHEFLGLLARSVSYSGIDVYSATGTSPAAGVGRISYRLGLEGPAVAIDTACSSSLVAVHQACQALRSGECDVALAGGVNVILSPAGMINMSRGRVVARDGRCKAFDASADGYVRGEGCGVIVLKRLADAHRDADRVRAVIRGCAANQDGASGGLTVPSGRAQQRVITDALRQAGLEPGAVDYLEAHGTGTPLGDPIEVRAVAAALGAGRRSEKPLLIGSVKTNIGHLEAAAGIAGVIKVVLALEHKELPKHLHFETPSPHIPWKDLPVKVVSEPLPWHTNGTPRIAGVNSFGFSGTNAHVIIAEAPENASSAPAAAPAARPYQLLPISARTPEALRLLAARHADWMAAHPEAAIADVSYSAAVGRSHLEHRGALVVDTSDRARRMLRALAEERAVPGVFTGVSTNPPKTAWLFTGQGSPYAGMGRELYETYPVVRSTLDRCESVVRGDLDVPLLEAMFEHKTCLQHTRYAQPALFALEAAIAHLWQSWGIQPDVVMGHSVGQYAAAYVAGVFTLEDGLRLMAARGALFGALPEGGRMAAIFADARVVEDQAQRAAGVSIAAYNGVHSVVSGPESAMQSLIAQFEAQGVRCERLETSHAFHSSLLDPALDAFEARARQVTYEPARRTLVCNLTGGVLSSAGILDANYWRRHARQPVQFASGVRTLSQLGCEVLLEVGPQPVLTAMALNDWPEGRPQPRAIASLRRDVGACRQITEALAQLYTAGAQPDFRAVDGLGVRERVDLATYPFQRRRFWFTAGATAPTAESSTGSPVVELSADGDVATSVVVPDDSVPANELSPEAVAAADAWLLEIEPADRTARIIEFLRDELAKALGIAASDLDPDAPFATLGIDSLMATELRNRVQTTLGTSVPAAAFVFTYPTITTLAEGLLQRWTEVRQDPTQREVTIPRVPRGDTVAPSYAQEQLWFLQQLSPTSSAYNIAVQIRIRGGVDYEGLAATFDAVVARHEALRMTFRNESGIPQVVIVAPFHVDLPLHEINDEGEITTLGLKEAGTAFDLASGPLFRVRLLRLHETDHVLLVTMHHIITDGWSFKVFSRDLAETYAALRSGRAPALPDLVVQYPDYALWQREQLKGDALDRLLAFWKQNLDGAPALELTTDRPRPVRPTFRGARIRFELGHRRAQAIRALCAEENLTVFVPLMAAFAALLQRYSGQDDFVVGTLSANRARPEVDSLIGFFVNALPLRMHLEGDPSVRELLARTRDCMLDAVAHEEAPFDLIVNSVERQRHANRQPLFQVQFVLQAAVSAGLPGVEVEVAEIDTQTAKRDLTLTIFEDGTLTGHVEYATDLFDKKRIEQLIAHFETLCDGLTSVDRAHRISTLPLLTDSERALYARRRGARVRSIQQMFEDAVDRTPDAPAVSAGERTLTYRQLDAAANRVARWLSRCGVGPNAAVTLRAGRTLDMPIGLLGILKAGGVYVPLDPAYPSDRLDFMRLDSGAVVHVEALDDPAITRESTERVESGSTPGDLAYIIYTSGSTGTPKGVRISHESVVEYVDTLRRALDIEASDVYLHTASISFSSSIRQMLVPLTSGAALVIAARDECRDPLALLRRIRDSRVTIADLVPTVVSHVVEAVADLPALDRAHVLDNRLRLLLTASEPLRYGLVHDWRTQVRGGARWINMYGQTETTGIVSLYPVAEADAEDQRIVPIGRPRDNVSMLVLDSQRRPLPPGMTGDLYIGGVALAQGYTGDPALTAERFIPNAIGDGERLYAAGDVVRMGWDGTIEFVGRSDQQVKVRGLRIEPGEIERVLLMHPAVRESIVTLSEADASGPRLVAYFTARGPAPSVADLRAHAREKLPEHMVPSAYVALERLPLTPNGKIDRAALPMAEALPAETGAPIFVPPRAGVEEALAAIWRKALRIERIGAADNFFDLGGHSLLAAQVRSRIRNSLGVDLPLTALFEDQTLAALAVRIAASTNDGGHSALPPLVSVLRSSVLPASYAQSLSWQREQAEPGSPGLWIDVALGVHGPLDVTRLIGSVHAAVRRHELLRTVYERSNGDVIQRILDAYTPTVRMLEQPVADTDDTCDAGDLSANPPFAADLCRTGPNDHTLNVHVHRILCDGFATRLLLSEIGALYMNTVGGIDHFPLLDPSLQYADYAVWERQWLTRQALQSHVAFFRKAFDGVDSAFSIPSDHERPARRRYRGGRLSLDLPRPISDRASAKAVAEQASLYTVLVSAFAWALGRHTGRPEAVIGSPISRRIQSRTEQMLGPFMNILPLRVRHVQDEPSRLVRHVKTVLLDALAHQDAPQQDVAAALAADYGAEAAGFDEVVFVMGESAPREIVADKLTLTRIESQRLTSRRDLTVSALAVNGDISIAATYDRDLFAGATIQRLVDDFVAALSSM